MTPALELKREPDGTRYVRPYLGTNAVTGRPLRPYHRFRDELTDEQCMEEAREWYRSLAPANGMRVGTKLGALLARYIDDLELQGSPVNTVRTYRTLAGYAGRLADRDVRDIAVWEIDDLYSHLLQDGGRDGEGLSGTTVLAFHWFLRGAFNWMAALGIVDISPVVYASHPRFTRGEAVALGGNDFETIDAVIENELGAFPTNTKGAERRSAAFAAYLALNAGLRCGEACALRRRDVLRDAAGEPFLHVGGTVVEPKGGPMRQPFTKGKRVRNIALTEDDMAVIDAHMAWLSELPSWSSGTPLVTMFGNIERPSTVSRIVSEIFREAGLPEEATFHSLRHTHASWLLAHGADIKTVSERLGHSNVTTTLQIYAHVMPGRDRAAAEIFRRAKREG